MNKIYFLGLAVLLFAAGCSSTSRTTASRSFQTKRSLPPEYLLGFGDVIEVKFFNNERFNETVRVRPDGRISLEKVGDIVVAGMTPSRLDSLVTKIYAEIIQNPDVTIFVREFGDYQVYVLGEVNTAGGYAVARDMTMLQAIASAGGATDDANLGSVMLLRYDEEDRVAAIAIDLEQWIEGGVQRVPAALKYVQPRDILYVPKTFIASTTSFLQQVYDGLIPPVNVYLQALLWSRWRR